jgi:pSer/pThr/pTyr-binding forkhead associated (FHA) protein
MAGGDGDRRKFWVDGQFTVRLRGLGSEPGRIIRLRRPFALIGQIPGADIRIDDPAVDGRHALLLLDRRGVFGVDLLSRSGTRFAGAGAASAWLGPGDILEIAGRRVELLQLRIDGTTVEPPLSDDDPFSDSPGLVGLTLEPLDVPGPPWMLGSALAFVGRGDACAIRIDNASASMTHCALWRGPSDVYLIDLLGRRTLINDQVVEGASALLDGDILTIGQARLAVRLEPSISQQLTPSSAVSPLFPGEETGVTGVVPPTIWDEGSFVDQPTFHGSLPGAEGASGRELTLSRDTDRVVGIDPRGAMVAILREAMGSGREAPSLEILDVLRQFQADTATLLEAQIDRIETMNQEIATLREEIRGHLGPPPEPAEPLRLDLLPPPVAPSAAPASWLLDRLNTVEAETRTTWKDLLGRITSTVGLKDPAQPGQSLVPAHSEPDRTA